MDETPFAFQLPSALLIGVDDETAEECASVLKIPVRKVPNVAAARDHVAEHRPIVIVAGARVSLEELETLRELGGAVGARLVSLAVMVDSEDLREHVQFALSRARTD